jgi:DNA repair exonuclease SbcCD ATPase subunit
MFSAVLDKLAGRMRQRTATAHERIEGAAKAAAAGENIDVAGLEDALFTVSMSLDGFRELCDLFVARRERFAKLDGLGPARKRLAKTDAEIEAANASHAEAVEQYRKRYAALREEANEAQTVIDAARDAREWLLAVANCPPSLKDDYALALAGEQKALEAVGDAEREIRRLNEAIRNEAGWIQQHEGEDVRLIHAPQLTVAKSARDKLSAEAREKVEHHERRIKRFEGELIAANKTLDECRKQQAAAEASLATVRKKILAL